MFLDNSKIQFCSFQGRDLFMKLEENSCQQEPGGVLSIFSSCGSVLPRNISGMGVPLTRISKTAAGAEINLYL